MQDRLTALQWAATIEDATACEEIIGVLCAAGANVNAENRDDELVSRAHEKIKRLPGALLHLYPISARHGASCRSEGRQRGGYT